MDSDAIRMRQYRIHDAASDVATSTQVLLERALSRYPDVGRDEARRALMEALREYGLAIAGLPSLRVEK